MSKPELTDSQIQLAILKTVIENNGMLQAIMKSLAEIQSSMQVVDLPEGALERMRESYSEVLENAAKMHENLAWEKALGYAKS